jgi:Nuclease-related domain
MSGRGPRRPHGERGLLEHRLSVFARHRRGVTAGAVAVAGCLIDVLLLADTPEYRGFVAGAVAASTSWLIATKLLLRASARTPGVPPETLSRELIGGVPQWLAVHDLPLDGRNIDHVVLTPLAVLAVRTAWWGPASDSVHQRRREEAMDQARHEARTLRRLLASRRLGFELPVWPVVLSWGPGAEETQLGPVDVVAGEHAGSWTAAYRSGAIPRAVTEQVHAALLGYQSKHDTPSRPDTPASAA